MIKPDISLASAKNNLRITEEQQMKRISVLLIALAMLAALMTGCAPGNNAPTEPAQTPVAKDILDENVDAMGNEVTSAAQDGELTIVSTAPSATEILFALGCGDNIVGIDVSSTYPEETANIEIVGDFNGFDVEKVIALNPTVVFAGNGLQHEDIAALEDAGLNVVAVEATYYEDIATSITMIGSVVGKEDEAAALNAQIAEVEKAVKEKAATFAEKPSVYYVMGIGEYGNWTSGEGSFINTIIEMAGGVPTTAGTDAEWLEYPVEDLVTSDPDILLVSNWVAEEDLVAAVGYSDLTAIKEGHYYFITPDIIERPGPRITEALETLQGDIETFLQGE
jgi:iron complex transport system substrate-binding protein